MAENLQLESIAYWNDAILKVQKKIREMRKEEMPTFDGDPLWDEAHRLIDLESYATRCLALANIGRLKPFVRQPVSELAYLDGL